MDMDEEIVRNIESKHKEQSLGTFRMVYENSSRAVSERDVDIIRFVMTERKRGFYAYCHLKNTFREFSFKGVRRLFVGEEEIADPQTFLLELYKKSGGKVEAFKPSPELDTIRAVWFFACADGLQKRHELNAVKKWVQKIMPDVAEKLGTDWLDKIKTSAEDMVEISQRLVWTKKLARIYEDAVHELLEIKQKRYSDSLRRNLLIDLWPPYFQSAAD